MANYKKAIELDGLDPRLLRNEEVRKDSSKIFGTGVAGDKLIEPQPVFNSVPSERVISGDNGSYIILGRDRNAEPLSGYGGKGDTGTASIDIVVGRLGHEGKTVDSNGEKVIANPDFKRDAARIYISQKCDVDEYFGLSPGPSGLAKTKSAIGLKADNIRIMSREGVNIVSDLDNINSQGANKKGLYGINLVGGNDLSDLQSIPKGQNLIEFLKHLVDYIDSLSGIFETFVRFQMEFNTATMLHTHAAPGAPSAEMALAGTSTMIKMSSMTYSSIVNQRINAGIIKLNYLNPIGGNYINSRYNKTS